MESIKETELNLQREVVATVPNTWLVEAVNPSTGEKKMIDIANYASVVAEQIGTGTVINQALQAGESYAINESSYAIYAIVDRSKVGFGALFGIGYSSIVIISDPKTVIGESKISITKSGAGKDTIVTNNYDVAVNIRIRKLV